MSNVPGVVPSAAAGVPYHSAKRTRVEYSNVSKTGQKNKKISKNTKKFKKFKQNDKNNVKKITNPSYNPQKFTEASYGGSNKKIGCSWTQFFGDIDEAIDYVALTVELYQTVTLEEGTQIITIPNTKNVNIREVVEAVNNNFTKN
ncbi:hypothetical protein BB561_003639 [Smittium simulii]|uniref:Uncharacterized protein n=1 Tax=Smittium simulii TaxID=133385 RepID=A0A2T9YK78_9FUNG|nr:hypothetical protein BB561_003639 [Smittium simulii]